MQGMWRRHRNDGYRLPKESNGEGIIRLHGGLGVCQWAWNPCLVSFSSTNLDIYDTCIFVFNALLDENTIKNTC